MKYILVLLLLFGGFLYADTEFADPKPSIDNPRRFVFPISEGTDSAINHVLSSANNVMKFYGPESVKCVLFATPKGSRHCRSSEVFPNVSNR